MFEAIYCENGHFVASKPEVPDYMLRRGRMDEGFQKQLERLAFCTRCGRPSLGVCPGCKASIVADDERPSYCGSCGKPYPWTQVALQAANEYTDELDGLSEGDKATLKGSFSDLTMDTARTPLAASRFKRILAAAGPTAKDMVSEILKGTLTNVAKELLGIKG